MERDAASSCHFSRVRHIQQGSQAPGIQLRGFNRYICAHAGGRYGERPPYRLFPPSRDSGDWVSQSCCYRPKNVSIKVSISAVSRVVLARRENSHAIPFTDLRKREAVQQGLSGNGVGRIPGIWEDRKSVV